MPTIKKLRILFKDIQPVLYNRQAYQSLPYLDVTKIKITHLAHKNPNPNKKNFAMQPRNAGGQSRRKKQHETGSSICIAQILL